MRKAVFFRYAVALGAVAAALALRVVLTPWLGERVPYITLFGAVIVAAWHGGAAPAIAAAVAGWVGAELLLIGTPGTIQWRGTPQAVEAGAYFISAMLIAALGGAMHRMRVRARESEQRFRTFIENSPVAVFIKDQNLRYLFANRAAQKALGSTTWEGRTDFDLVPAAAAEQIQANDRKVLEQNAPAAFDITVTRPEGTRHYHSTKFPLRDASGEVFVGVVSVDVTGQSESERAAREAQQLLQTVADAMPAVVTLCSRDLRYLWINREGAAWLGMRPEEIIGRHMADVIGDAALAAIRPHIDRALAGEAVSYERRIEYASKGPRWVHARMAPAAFPEGAWVAVISDVQDRKQAEEALKAADRRKDEFLATLAHELRNPLAPIRNAVAILSRKDVAESDLAWSRGLIERQVGQMTRLIEDLLDVARISSGKLTVRRERMPLRAALEMSVETSRPHLEEAGVRLVAGLPSADVTVEADSTRLAQVFSNLLNNAARHTNQGGTVEVRVRQAGEQIEVSVVDSGSGFPPELADAIFEPFMQATPSGSRAGGLGIGLALARGIVALHGGTITAKSAGLGRGSEFVVRLPIAASDAATDGIASAPAAAAPVHRLRVLVADDNRDAADSLARMLAIAGHEIRVAYDGTEAIAEAALFRPDAAVLDIGMPGASGYDVARALRASFGNSMRLVALTGWGQASDRQKATDAGFDHHLTKPADPAAVVMLLDDVVGR